jgi:hypothetical protein
MKTIRNIKIRLYSCLIILAVLTVSCQKDILDTKIDNNLTDVNLQSSYSSIFQFAVAPYVFVNQISNGFASIDSNLFAVCSDEAIQTSSGFSNSTIFTQGLITPYNNPDNIYNVCYQGIRSANYFLENFKDFKARLAYNRDTLSDNALQYHLDIKDIGFYLAEARVLRAYFYYELIKRYGGVPLVTSTLNVDQSTNLPKADIGTIVNFIAADIDSVINNLQPNWVAYDQAKDGRLTKAGAISIKLSAFVLYASPLHNPGNDVERWKRAAIAANDIISLDQFKLDKSYGNLFFSDNTVKSIETIWALRLGATNDFERRNYPLITPGGHNEITPSNNLVSAYEYVGSPDPTSPFLNRDPRLALSIVTNNSTWTGRTIQTWAGGTDDYTKGNVSRTGFYLKKFMADKLDLVKNKSNQRSWIIFRYAETLLKYAEAMNEAYGPDNNNGYSLSARDAINAVRARSGVAMPAVVAGSQSEMRDKIKHERRIELAFEGYRYWDLVRWKDAEGVLNSTVTGVVATMNIDSTFNYTTNIVESRVFAAPKMYLYPIPQSEIAKSDGALAQNPGW